MSKVRNEVMKGRELITSFGIFSFDAEGIAEVPEEYVAKLTSLKGYKVVALESVQNDVKTPELEVKPTEEEKPQIDGKNDAEDIELKEEKPDEDADEYTVEELEKKNVAQLRKLAKDNDIDLSGATTKSEIIPILIGALNN